MLMIFGDFDEPMMNQVVPAQVKALRRLARGVGITPSSSKGGVPDAGGARFRYSGTCAYHAAAALPPDAWHDDSEAAWGTRPAHSGAQARAEIATVKISSSSHSKLGESEIFGCIE